MHRAIATFGLFGLLASAAFGGEDKTQATAGEKDRVFEMRTYYTHEGRLPALNKRFREHTRALFKKHGMENIGYWVPAEDKDGKNNTLIYLLAYPSMEAREKSWKAFQADPEWQKVRDASEVDGKIVQKVVSVFLNPTDYSAIK